MRYLVFLRGVPGSGKSTFIRENNLEPYTISSDSIRLILKPPVLSVTGKPVTSQKINHRVWGLIYSLIKSHMEDGDFIILDATNAGNADIAKYRKLVRFYRYEAVCIDFTDVPLEIAKQRNRKRPEYEIVPEKVIDEMYSIISRQTVPSFVKVIKPQEFHERLRYKATDFSRYRRIHHIGDINGNYSALMEYLTCGLNESDLYIFLGDYAGSGTENAGVIKFLTSIMCRDNVVLLEGEHESCSCRPAEGEEPRRFGFPDTLYNLPEMKQADITEDDILDLCKKLRLCAYYKFQNRCVLVTHGGLSSLPENLIFVGADQMINGVGDPGDAYLIATSFNNNTNENTYQVHGHRNPENLPIKNGRTFNLCPGKDDFLRVVTLDRDGFYSREIKKGV
ncbi:serine/threonine protein phosphatase [Methanosarcina sp. MSH10X1]|uniref:AAA family ATPase n=1 Tax=Methanosarcina sp. MSH10X1 TaxID=2507075 RepID=UPI000FFB3E86|nr:AAA family ATPase [Methanosarcina sp. MSH10X1]RXA20570.1 serine/threonine protein phosphatase [Methanosarcina sp. MSH10X1]